MRTDFKCGRGRGRQRHFTPRVHIHAIRVRLHGRLLRGAFKQTRSARRGRSAQVLCNAVYSLLDYHGSFDDSIRILHKTHACVGERHRAKSRSFSSGVHLLSCDFSRYGGATVLQLYHQHIAKHRRLVHAAFVFGHIDGDEHRSRPSFHQSFRLGRCGSCGSNHSHASALHGCMLYLHLCKIQVFAP